MVDTACDWVKPIYLTDHDIDVLDRQTKKDILMHNKVWEANCNQSIKQRMHRNDEMLKRSHGGW